MHNLTIHCNRKHFCRYCLDVFNTAEILLTIHRDRKHFCPYCLDAFSTAEILKSNV